MRYLSFCGKEYEFSEQYFFDALTQLANGYLTLTEAYFQYHLSGFADQKGIFQLPDKGQNELEKNS